MTINYTTLLGLAKPVTGTETGQWGDVVNDQITSMLEDAVANAATFSVTAGNVTLTTANGSTSQSRMSTLIITGTPGTTRNVVAPSQAKIYQVINQSNGAVVIKGSATTGCTIAAGASATVVWNGSDFVEITSTSSGRTFNGNIVVNGTVTAQAAATQDAVVLQGRAGGTSSYTAAFTPATLSASRTVTIPDATFTLAGININQTLTGVQTLSPTARTSGAASYFTLTTPADTSQTASTESIGANFTAGTRTWATGALALQRERVFAAPTYAFATASTLTTAVNVDIANPVAGTNATITNAYALRAGNSYFTGAARIDGNVTLDGGTANGVPYLNGSKVLTTGSALTFDGATSTLYATNAKFGNGVAANSSKLMINTASGFAAGIQLYQDGNESWIMENVASSTALRWMASGSEKMRIDGSGNVGIGTTPSYKLDIAASIGNSDGIAVRVGNISGTSASGSARETAIAFYDANNPTLTAAISGDRVSPSANFNGALVFRTSGTGGSQATSLTDLSERMRIDSSGNVGIGISNPSYKLVVSDAGNNGFEFIPDIGTPILQCYDRTALAYKGMQLWAEQLLFITGSSPIERMRIDSSGNLLVGTTTSGARLNVVGSGTTSGTFTTKMANSAGTIGFQIRDDGFVGSPMIYASTNANSANLFVASDGYIYRSTSSIKYKRDVEDATHGLAEVMQLRSVTYKGKSKSDDDKIIGGLIAEEVHAVGLTEFVQYAEDGSPDALAYGNMVSLLVKAIQELKAENDSFKSRLDAANL